MKNWKKWIAAGLTAGMLMLSLSGCAITDGIAAGYHTMFGLGSNQMFRIEDEVCTKGEAMIFLSSQKSMYESAYGTSIWKVEVEDRKDFEDYMLDSLQEFLARLKTMQIMAEKEKLSLTKEEIAKAEAAGAEYYSQLGKDQAKKLGISKKTAAKAFEEYLLANKLADRLTMGENSTISDSEARIIHIQQIFLPAGTAGAQSTMEEALEKARAGSDFESLAKRYGKASEISLIIGRGELPAEAEEAAFALTDYEISSIVETEEGYYIIKCVEDYDAAATQTNKGKIAEQRKADAFLKAYEAFSQNCSSELNEKAWKNLSYKNIDAVDANFYDVYSRYFGEAE